MSITETHNTLDVHAIRADFPILKRKINGKDLIYFDNAASTQKPQQVIDTVTNYYSNDYSNIHRGVHTLSQIGTAAYEAVREKARNFINAGKEHEIIYTHGTTDGINLVASSFGRKFIQPGDEILISGMEHHSNIVPWQLMCEERGAVLKVIPLKDDGSISIEDVRSLINEKTKLVSIVYVSNSLGSTNPVKDIIRLAHDAGVKVLVDGAQAVQHMDIDVQDLDADLFVFSGHKMYGTTGTGILYGKEALLEELPPYQGGGDMIKEVSFEKTTFNDLPFKFEAGTPNIAGFIGLGAAFDYLNRIGLKKIAVHEAEVLEYATERILNVEGIRIIGDSKDKCSVLSFVVNGLHPYDIGVILDNLGIAIRTGHHCTQPVMAKFGIPGTCRASFAMYNTKDEVDEFIAGLQRAVRMLR
ncbi:MAG: cysteine desulfurase [Bacteroidetes bacterium]|nr:cysteine desulfurase [Bacteroidota bacterium]